MSAADRRRGILGVCLVAAPLALLAADLESIVFGNAFARFALGKLAFALFVPAALALVHVLSRRADRTGLVGGSLALLGAVGGATIFTLAAVEDALDAAALDATSAAAIAEAMNAGAIRDIAIFYPIPGIAFPIGHLVLAIGLLRVRVVSPVVPVVHAIGALLFPLGRIASIDAAILGSDIAMAVALGALGVRVLAWSADEWRSLPERSERDVEIAIRRA